MFDMGTHNFIGTCPDCGRVVATVADAPSLARQVDAAVGDYARAGLAVSRVPRSELPPGAWVHAEDCPRRVAFNHARVSRETSPCT